MKKIMKLEDWCRKLMSKKIFSVGKVTSQGYTWKKHPKSEICEKIGIWEKLWNRKTDMKNVL